MPGRSACRAPPSPACKAPGTPASAPGKSGGRTAWSVRSPSSSGRRGLVQALPVSSVGGSFFGHHYGTAVPGKKPVAGCGGARKGNFGVKPGCGCSTYLTKLCSLSRLTGICRVGRDLQALAAIAAFYSVEASRRNLFSSSPIRALRPPVGMRLAASIKPASSVFRSVPLSEPSSRQPFNRLSLKEAVMSSAVRPCNVSNVE